MNPELGQRTRFDLLGRGAVTVWRVDTGTGDVDVRVGDGGEWDVIRRGWEWACSCPIVEGCVHIEAARRVVPRRGMSFDAPKPDRRRWRR
jgi:hypothetical protein